MSVTIPALSAWLSTVLEDNSFAIENLVPASHGFSSETAAFDLVREAGQPRQSLMLKLSPNRVKLFPRDDLAMQHALVNALSARGFPAPRSLWLELDPRFLGGPFIVMEKIEGVGVSDAAPGPHGHGLLYDADEGQRGRYWAGGVETLARLHAIDASHSDFAMLGRPADSHEALADQIAYLRGLLAWCEMDQPRVEDLHRGLDWLASNSPEGGRVGICWGDAKVGNLLFGSAGVCGVLDWELAHLGAPEFDLAYWILVDEAACNAYRTPRLSGLPDAAETVALYEQLTGRAVENFHYAMAFQCCRLAVFLALASRLDAKTKFYGFRPDYAHENATINRMRAMLSL